MAASNKYAKVLVKYDKSVVSEDIVVDVIEKVDDMVEDVEDVTHTRLRSVHYLIRAFKFLYEIILISLRMLCGAFIRNPIVRLVYSIISLFLCIIIFVLIIYGLICGYNFSASTVNKIANVTNEFISSDTMTSLPDTLREMAENLKRRHSSYVVHCIDSVCSSSNHTESYL